MIVLLIWVLVLYYTDTLLQQMKAFFSNVERAFIHEAIVQWAQMEEINIITFYYIDIFILCFLPGSHLILLSKTQKQQYFHNYLLWREEISQSLVTKISAFVDPEMIDIYSNVFNCVSLSHLGLSPRWFEPGGLLSKCALFLRFYFDILSNIKVSIQFSLRTLSFDWSLGAGRLCIFHRRMM